MNLPTKRIGAHALPLPRYEHEGDVGMDLRARIDVMALSAQGYPYLTEGMGPHGVELPSGCRILLGCGFAFAIPSGFEGQVRPRSGHSKKGVYCALGTIDAPYRGEVGVLLTNMSDDPFVIWEGDRIAQLVIAPVALAEPVEVAELDETERGDKGYGSSGVR